MFHQPSRRRFLDRAIAAGVVAGVAGVSLAQRGGSPLRSKGLGAFSRQLNLGVWPIPGPHELVVHPESNIVFATFAATDGNNEGIGVLEAHGCSDWSFGGNLQDQTSVSTDQLPVCSVCEIQNSEWAAGTDLRHFVVSLMALHPGIEHRGKNLELLAQSIHIELFPPCPYDDVVAYIDTVNAMSGRMKKR